MKRVVVTAGICCAAMAAWAQTPPPLIVVPPTEHPLTWVDDVLPQGATRPFAVGLHNCLEQYPDKAKADHIEGITSLTYRIAEDGSVKSVAIAKSSGSDALDKAAVSCVKAWTYGPAMLEGKPIEISWRNDVKWVIATYAAAHPPIPAGAVTPPPPPPPHSAPFTIGQPHMCMSEYPPDAVVERAQGTVLVRFIITAEGTTTNISVTESSGYTALDDAAVTCVGKWRYGPAKNSAGEPIAVPNAAKIVWSMV